MFNLRPERPPMPPSPPTGPGPGEMVEYDISGQLCPSTLLTALKAVNERQDGLRRGALALRFKTDNRDAITTIPDAVAHMGYVARVRKEGGYYLVEISAAESRDR